MTEKREAQIQDLAAFMEIMSLNTLSTQKDYKGYRFYITVEPIEEELDEEP